MSFNGPLFSPEARYRLSEITGNPTGIETAGNHYIDIGARMTATAAELGKLSRSEKYKADSLDKIRESAGELQADLDKVAERYTKTGPVLVAYAEALRTAQDTTVDPYVPLIREAHQDMRDAEAAERAADREVDDLRTVWIWESDPSEAETRAADRAASDASTAASGARGKLEGLWESFEAGYADWDSAYETAVDGVGDAISASGVDDSWWEDALDGLATVAGIVGAIAVVAALIITGPIAAVLLVIATVAAVVALVAHLTMMAAGSRRASWGDIAFDAIGLIPFAGSFAKAMRGGAGVASSLRIGAGAGAATRGTINAGRNALVRDLSSVTGAGRFAGNRGARELAAPGIANRFLSGVDASWGRNSWNAIRAGGTRMDGVAITMSERLASAWPGAGQIGERSARFVAENVAPSRFMQGVNVWALGSAAYDNIANPFGLPGPADAVDAGIDVVGDAIRGG
ncbi:hypothetical protein LG299_13835 [Microbacterium lacus]|uniref:hypothetical protein n=1 Tax=Microbacterium lacus TaxID=415217 RepID=UPI00384B52F3